MRVEDILVKSVLARVDEGLGRARSHSAHSAHSIRKSKCTHGMAFYFCNIY